MIELLAPLLVQVSPTAPAATGGRTMPLLQPMTEEEWQRGAGCYGRDRRGRVLFAHEFGEEAAIIKIDGRLVRPAFPTHGNTILSRYDGYVEARVSDTVVRFRRVRTHRMPRNSYYTRETVVVSVTHRGATDARTLIIECGD